MLGHLDAVKPSLLVMDSVQTVASPEIDGAPGGMAQVREVAGALIRASKERGMATLLVGHVTKDGAIAGPRLGRGRLLRTARRGDHGARRPSGLF